MCTARETQPSDSTHYTLRVIPYSTECKWVCLHLWNHCKRLAIPPCRFVVDVVVIVSLDFLLTVTVFTDLLGETILVFHTSWESFETPTDGQAD
jgi:hypothetical protein